MAPRILIRLAPPLALTLLLLLAEALGWPGAVRWGALVAMTSAWLFAFWAVTRPDAVQSASLREQTRLLDDLLK